MITSKQRFVLAVLLLVAPFAFAQQSGRITGTVFDDARKPLVGASVTVANTTRGVSTSSDGKFEIVASPNETLVISYLGYAAQEIRVGSRTHIDVTLKPQANLIEDLVVVGYGVQKRVNVTGAVSSVNYAKEAESRPVTSTAQLLQGMNAGLMVSQTSGQPGQEGMLMRIRGIGTLNDSAPLVIVDGFEGSIGNVNPDDIESVSVLKDAASCAIYGNRGANGVVLITTKTGGTGKFNISYNGMVAFNRPANHFGVVSNYADYMELINESAENIDGTLPFSQAMIDLWREKEKDPNGIADSGYPNYVAYPNTDWMEAMFENNVYHKHNLSASGSSGNTKYLMSFSYVNNPGVVARTGTERFQLRTNVSSQVTKWLEIGTKLWGYEGTRELSDFSGASGYMSRATPGIYPYYDGKYGWMENSEQSSSSRNNLYFINRFGGEEKSHYVNAAIFANVKLPYRIRYNVSFNYARSSSEHKYYGKTCYAFSFSKNDWAYRYEDLTKLALTQTDKGTYRWTFQNNFAWDYTFAEKHDLTTLVGFEAMYSNSSNLTAKKTGFAQDKLVEFDTATTVTSIDGTQTDFATASFFGRLTYAYDNRYLFETNLRYDGSSRFARKSRWGLFPSVSAGWRISQEAFMQDSGIDNLKLRASWGKLGNHAIGNYEYQATYASGYLYSFGGKQSPGIVASLSNNLLEWETTTSTNVGLELGVLHNRLSFEMDYYKQSDRRHPLSGPDLRHHRPEERPQPEPLRGDQQRPGADARMARPGQGFLLRHLGQFHAQLERSDQVQGPPPGGLGDRRGRHTRLRHQPRRRHHGRGHHAPRDGRQAHQRVLPARHLQGQRQLLLRRRLGQSGGRPARRHDPHRTRYGVGPGDDRRRQHVPPQPDHRQEGHLVRRLPLCRHQR